MNQVETTTSRLMRQTDDPRDLAYWIGEFLRAPVRDIPTREDFLEQQPIRPTAISTEQDSSRQAGQGALDYLSWLGPLLGILTARESPTREPRCWKRGTTPIEDLQELYESWPPWQGPVPYQGPPLTVIPRGLAPSLEDTLIESWLRSAHMPLPRGLTMEMVQDYVRRKYGVGGGSGVGDIIFPD